MRSPPHARPMRAACTVGVGATPARCNCSAGVTRAPTPFLDRCPVERTGKEGEVRVEAVGESDDAKNSPRDCLWVETEAGVHQGNRMIGEGGDEEISCVALAVELKLFEKAIWRDWRM